MSEPEIIEGSAVVVAQHGVPAMPTITVDKLRVLGNALGSNLDANELTLFAEVANRSGLDPFAKQIFAIRRKGKVTFQTGIDGYRSIAARTGEYDGQDEPVYGPPCPCGDARTWGAHPEFATVRVYRKGMGRGVAATAYWHEYAPTGEGETFMWRKMARVMIAKVAEALGLRKAFPYVYGGLYTDDEMAQAGDAPATAPTTASPQPQGAPQAPAAPSMPNPTATRGASAAADAPATFTGKVNEAPDGVRSLADGTPKLEVRFKVGNSQHTAIVTGPLARATWESGLVVEGATVAVKGVLRLITWSEDKSKPRKKQVEDVTAFAVAADGEWVRIEPLTLPLDDAPGRGPFPTAHATPATPSTVSVPGVAADASTTSASGERIVTNEDLMAEADLGALDDGDVFDESLFTEAVAVFDPMSLPVYRGVADEPFEQRVAVISFDLTATGRRHFWVAAHDYDGGRVRIEVLAQPGDTLTPSEVVHVAGMWRAVRDGMVLAASEVTA